MHVCIYLYVLQNNIIKYAYVYSIMTQKRPGVVSQTNDKSSVRIYIHLELR